MGKTILVPQYDWSKLIPESERKRPKKNVSPHTYRQKSKLVNRVRRPRAKKKPVVQDKKIYDFYPDAVTAHLKKLR